LSMIPFAIALPF